MYRRAIKKGKFILMMLYHEPVVPLRAVIYNIFRGSVDRGARTHTASHPLHACSVAFYPPIEKRIFSFFAKNISYGLTIK